jgi:YHS domain-containing protein
MLTRLFSLTLLFTAAALAGCGSSTPTANAPTAKDDKPALTDADKALIEKQKLCLVANEPLGSMGTPVKVTVKGKDVFLCCEHCREAVLKDPDKYLAKLDANGTVIVDPKTGEEHPKTDAAPAPAPAGDAAPKPN